MKYLKTSASVVIYFLRKQHRKNLSTSYRAGSFQRLVYICMQKYFDPETGFMFARLRLIPHVNLLLLGFVLSLSGPVAEGQETTPQTPRQEITPTGVTPNSPDQSAETDKLVPLDQVSNRAEAISVELDMLVSRDNSNQFIEQFRSETENLLRDVKPYLQKTPQTLAGRSNIRALQRLESKTVEMLDNLQSLAQEIDEQLNSLGSSLEQIDNISDVWQGTDELAKNQADSEATTLNRIAAVRGEIEKSRSILIQQRNDLLILRDKLVNPSVSLNESVARLQKAVVMRFEGIFRVDHPPLWSPLVRESLRNELQNIDLRYIYERLTEDIKNTHRISFQFILFVALGLSLRWLRDRTRAKVNNLNNRRHVHAQLVFGHPWSMALLITALFTIPLHPTAPRSVGVIAAVLIVVASLRIVLRFLPTVMAPLAWGLAILFTIDRAHDLLDKTPTLERLVFLLEIVGGFSLLLWLLHPSRSTRLTEEWRNHPFVKLINIAMRVGAAIMMLAIIADLAGWSDLAVLLGGGVLRSGYLGLMIFVLLKVFHGLATFAMEIRPLQSLKAISKHRQSVDRVIERVLSILAIGLWGTLLIGQLGLLAPAIDVVKLILNASVTTGTLSVSVSDVLVFAFTIWLSFLLARLVQVLLQEDVFSRVHMARGLPYAVSNIARYSVILIGFMIGLLAAGVDMTKLAVVAGGLGVGIGFGLQNVVNNFVSGLILLFERPIDVGDTIDLPDISGTMKRIGIRASVIRTFDGAEVIVPNGMLISDSVTNWTLSDRRRRIDLDVGVEYGTPAQRVIDLLVTVAKTNPKVLSDPEPQALFVNFGDSSLDFKLRVWFNSDSLTYTQKIRSEIGVAVQKSLEDAGIGVPFPQRDIHLIGTPMSPATGLDNPEQQLDPGE